MFEYNIADVRCQEILQRLSERMKYKEILQPYIIKLYKNEYDENFKIETTSKNKADNFKNCGSDIWMDDEGHITGANFCKQRLCPVCNYRRSTMMWHKINEIVSLFPDNEFLLITLTVRNCKDTELNKTINHLLDSFHRITCRRTWKKNFKGYVRGLEITYNAKKNTYHPHIHILILASDEYYKSDYVDIHTLRKWWKESAHLNYFVQVNIKKVKKKEKAVAEVAKYAVKMSDILKYDISEQRLRATQVVASCINGRRLISTGGYITKAARILKISLDDDYDTFSTRKSAKYFHWEKGAYYSKKL